MTTTAKEIEKRIGPFVKWLRERGASVLAPTHEWELVRFTGDGGTSIIYCNKRGIVSFTGAAESAWNCYRAGGGSFKATKPGITRKRRDPIIRTLRARDGDLCFFCQLVVAQADESQEHLVAIAHGGPNHISNLVLAHSVCNGKAGALDAAAKIRLHVQARLDRARGDEEPLPACLRYRRRARQAFAFFPPLELALNG